MSEYDIEAPREFLGADSESSEEESETSSRAAAARLPMVAFFGHGAIEATRRAHTAQMRAESSDSQDSVGEGDDHSSTHRRRGQHSTASRESTRWRTENSLAVNKQPTDATCSSFMDDRRFGMRDVHMHDLAEPSQECASRLQNLLARARIQLGAPERATPKSAKTGTTLRTTTPVTAEAAAQLAATPRSLKPVVKDEAKEPFLGASFPTSIIGALLIASLLASLMYVPLEVFSTKIRTNCVTSCRNQTTTQRKLITQIVTQDVTPDCYAERLNALVNSVHTYVQVPPDEAIDNVWTTYRTNYKFNPETDFSSPESRKMLAFQAWVAITQQWCTLRKTGDEEMTVGVDWHRPHAQSLYLGWENGAFTGMRLTPYCRGSEPLARFTKNMSTLDSECAAEYMDCLPEPGPQELRIWQVNAENGEREGEMKVEVGPWKVKKRTWYTLQKAILDQARRAPGGPASVRARRAWSMLYYGADNQMEISWTAPIAQCGDYSCFKGVIGADISLKKITDDCTRHWEVLRRILRDSKVTIDETNSSVFLLNSVSRNHPEQEGSLIGAAHSTEALDGTLTPANESSQLIVNATAKALLMKYGLWDCNELKQTQKLTFRLSALLSFPPQLAECEQHNLTHTDFTSDDCLLVGTRAVKMDADTWWLAVAVLPMGAFGAEAVETALRVDSELEQITFLDQRLFAKSRLAGAGMFLVVVALSVGMGCCLNYHVSLPLYRLSVLMELLMNLDFAHDTQEFAELSQGLTARIRDVGKLQAAFCRLSRALEAFSRFVPEPVVRSIVRGEQKALRPHVQKKKVTIMFTSISDFTELAERLSERDVLLILTRYFTVMTRIVEVFEGVIAEILTDGLLVFWNTPQPVQDQCSKACEAALAMHKAMILLNAEFARMDLPTVSIRAGLHTGEVFSGNIGSDVKMKFGCMGDPMNLASRLEGMCRYYGVGVVCSSATREGLVASHGFVVRRLDLVQVKGKKEPTTVYEVIDLEPEGTHAASDTDAIVQAEMRRDRARRYEEALSAFQKARFEEARSLATALLDEDPGNRATNHLRDRASNQASAGLTDEERQRWTGVLNMLSK